MFVIRVASVLLDSSLALSDCKIKIVVTLSGFNIKEVSPLACSHRF